MSVTITNVMAVSLDGRIGKHALECDNQRRAYDFTNADDSEWVREQLTTADAVITGANSMRASGATWRVTNDRGRFPTWIVLTQEGLDKGLPFWKQHDVDRVLVSPSAVQSDLCQMSGVESWISGLENPAKLIVQRLEEQNLSRVLLFGGGMVNNLFYEAGLVNFAKVTLCPIIIGALASPYFVNPGLSHEVKLSLIASVAKGNLVFLTYKIQI